MKKVRFEALAGYCRRPEFPLFGEEVAWYSTENESVLVAVIRDHEDKDLAGVFFGKDLKERYRFIEMTDFAGSIEAVKAITAKRLASVVAELDKKRVQGDEKGRPIDFFKIVSPKKATNPDFLRISTQEEFSPATEIIKPMMRWYEDADGNFIEQFQTTGFDARLWELYIFALLTELGFAVDRSEAIPDFSATSLFGDVCIEATTVNPSRDKSGNEIPPPSAATREEALAYTRQYVPVKYSTPLTKKLAKKYWERPNVAGKPFVLAVQDFHAPFAMNMTRTGLMIYLYGTDDDWYRKEDGTLVIVPRKVESHIWGKKQPVPSGYFFFPGAENVSAVIANTSATISKFNRMGVHGGFGSPRVRLTRVGTAINPDPNASEPLQFAYRVDPQESQETWVEGADVFHNPKALIPLDPRMFPGAAHHFQREDGTIVSHLPEWQPLTSETLMEVAI